MSDLVNAAELADEIVKRLAPVELPSRAGEWVRDQAKHGSYRGQILVGHDPWPWVMQWILQPDGRIELALHDQQNRLVWQTTLRPVGGP